MPNVGWLLTRRQLLSLRCLPAASFFLMCTLIIALCVYYWLQNKYVFIQKSSATLIIIVHYVMLLRCFQLIACYAIAFAFFEKLSMNFRNKANQAF